MIKVLGQYNRRLTKEDMYIYIAKEYGYSFDQIADMNPYRQHILCRGPRLKNMSAEEYEAYRRTR